MHGPAVGGHHPNPLQIGQPATTGLVVGVADVVTGRRAFAADFTITGHDNISSKNSIFNNRPYYPRTMKNQVLFSGARREAMQTVLQPAPAEAATGPKGLSE
jgi:hypothetical protein